MDGQILACTFRIKESEQAAASTLKLLVSILYRVCRGIGYVYIICAYILPDIAIAAAAILKAFEGGSSLILLSSIPALHAMIVSKPRS